jgi:DNA-binding response OmpR family regulator
MSARILVIDPDGSSLRTASQCLMLHGYAVVTAPDACAGLRCIRDFAPALVLTEILMPDKDGIECLLKIKRNWRNTKVVAMSGGKGILSCDFVLHLAARLGADGVLLKPFTPRHLANAVQAVLANRPIPVTSEDKP